MEPGLCIHGIHPSIGNRLRTLSLGLFLSASIRRSGDGVAVVGCGISIEIEVIKAGKVGGGGSAEETFSQSAGIDEV